MITHSAKKNRATERTVGVGVGDDRKGGGGGWTKFEKRVVGNIWERGAS